MKPAAIPDAPPKPGGDAAIQLLLVDRQTRFGADGDAFYADTAFRILTPAGLAAVNAITPSWDPQTETLIFHRFNLLRGGKVIDLLGGGRKVTVVRREKNLELAMLDGDLTAALQPEGLQVGDVVDVAFTLVRRDPIMQGLSEGADSLAFGGPINRVRMRVIWPRSKHIRWRSSGGLAAPKLEQTPAGDQLTLDLTDVQPPKPPAGAPPRFLYPPELDLTQFRDWAQVSALMAPLYAKAETLAPDSPLKREADKIRAAYASPKARAEAALRLVQDKVRYAFLGLNFGGYVPAAADVTWRRRFGDCKGKTVLLLALLRQLGVKAQPAFVSTTLGDGLDQRLPMLLFDHVLVRAVIGGKVYWLDGARIGDRDLDDIAVPNYHWALPIQAAGARLTPLAPKPLDAPAFASLLKLDASAGLDAAAPAHAENIYRGDAAVMWNLSLSAQGRQAADRTLRAYWREQRPSVSIQAVGFAYDDARRVMRLTMDGSATLDWLRTGTGRSFQIADSNLGFNTSFKRDPGPHADAPFAVPYPIYNQWTVILTLPAKGAGFGLAEADDVDETIAGRHFHRHSRIVDGVVTMVASERSLAPEFPASEAAADELALRKLADFNVTVVAPPTPAQPSAAVGDAEAPVPTDAAGFEARAIGYLKRQEYGLAIADFDRAVKLDPTSAEYVYNRGVARFENREDDLALADFDRALKLNPKNLDALEARAQIYLFRGDDTRAQQDFDAAERAVPAGDDVLLREAEALDNAGRREQAVRVYDRLIARKPTAWLYNARCWDRGEANLELKAALADCDASLKLDPDWMAALDSRAFVELRLGRLDAAIDDYTKALAAPAPSPWSLFGRGLAELRKGEAKAGQADLARAGRLEPGIAAEFARLGLRAPPISPAPAR